MKTLALLAALAALARPAAAQSLESLGLSFVRAKQAPKAPAGEPDPKAAPAAADPVFTPKDGAAPKVVAEKLTVTQGTYGSNPAYKLEVEKDHNLIVIAGKAKDWDSAKKACADLAPAGHWELPNAAQMMLALEAELRPALGPYYPFWAVTENPKTDAKLPGKDVFFTPTDTPGELAGVSLSGLQKQLQEAVKNPQTPPEAKTAMTAALQTLAAGLEVYCAGL